jgi:O-acetyl-ADP-ribose deacetylase (regulator of RNase III)
MIAYFPGSNILNSTQDALVNPINCLGVSGAGLAKQFAQKYPQMDRYLQNLAPFRPGHAYPWTVTPYVPFPKCVINVTTKDHWTDPSRLAWIESALDDINEILELHGWSVAVPPIGCGLGRLSWNQVLPLIESKLGQHDVHVYGPK